METGWLNGVVTALGGTNNRTGQILQDAINGSIVLEKYGVFINGNGATRILKLN
ncbi:hypothetical protein VB796_15945 [Arcicella sp. LKC2W]|uniref:hypothetical protein n=1 Tax=Arcicella sp. LKC2W TaxID=2984198 RepID=UPI002B1F2228|nr:hypothetical protein [Arcicella sp. LKC2W]MEA5460548.1 hypothetical protein [Arcicella sp. LKC2W]